MKALIEKVIQQRNAAFQFDEELNSLALIALIWVQLWSLLRGAKLLLYGKNSKWAIFGRQVALFNASRISYGRFLKLGDHVYLSALGKQGIELGNNVGIGAFSRVVVSTSLNNIGAHIKIGDNVGIGEFAYLGGAGGLEIGSGCIVGQYFSCHPENHNYQSITAEIRHQGVSRKGIKISGNCWIGSKVTILDGVSIGAGSIIAAGAVVNKSFPENSIIGGVPAKLIKTRTELCNLF
ncbi:MAG: acetyltransferase-like isoleucine patch superfamily enzyme [Marivirga sp.]|jgi:acetyltransferase-like isoleucine patch superfamily enzyme